MAIYHCSCNIISRSSGRSAVGASAYRSGEKLTNEYDGITHDYTRKSGVVYTEIMLPQNAPIEWNDRSNLWNAVEKIEKSSNAQLSREYNIALPRELSREEQIKLTQTIAHENFVSKGQCVDIAIHDKEDGNPHAHIMTTMRPIDENGNWENKSEKYYVCKNPQGEEKEFRSKDLQKSENAEWEKQFYYSKGGNPKGKKIYLTEYEKEHNPKYAEYERIKDRKYKDAKDIKVENPKMAEWNSKEYLIQVRENVEKAINTELKKKGIEKGVSCKSFKEQENEKIPTIHLGVTANAMEKRGIETDRGNINREIEKYNNELERIRAQEKQIKISIAHFKEDIAWNKHHEYIEKIENQIPKSERNKEELIKLQSALSAYSGRIESLKKFSNREITVNDEKVPYFDYHKNKILSDIENAQQQIKNRIESLQHEEPRKGGFEERRKEIMGKGNEEILKNSNVNIEQLERTAQNLAQLRFRYVCDVHNSELPKDYKPNMNYMNQAKQIEMLSNTIDSQTNTMNELAKRRNELGFTKYKEKKEIDKQLLEFQRLKEKNISKLKELGVEPSKAKEVIEQYRIKAQNEQTKLKNAEISKMSSARLEQDKQEFIKVVNSIPQELREDIHNRMMTHYNEIRKNHDSMFMEEVRAHKELDSALLQSKTQQRGLEQEKNHINHDR